MSKRYLYSANRVVIGIQGGSGLIGGAAFSTVIGLLFDFPLIWAFGPGFGMPTGIIIGAIMDRNKNKE